MKEMNLCTQRRHLAEAYYLVYLQHKAREKEEKEQEASERATFHLSHTGQLRSCLNNAIEDFEGFPQVKRPSRQGLTSFCEFLCRPGGVAGRASEDGSRGGNKETANALGTDCRERVLWCVDPKEWRPSGPPADLKRRQQVAVWLYCCSTASPAQGNSSNSGGASFSPSSSSAGAEAAPGLGASQNGGSKANCGPGARLAGLVRTFLETF